MPVPLPFERPLGATPDGVRVWAPKAEHAVVRLGREDHALESEGLGVWSGAPPWQAGDDYWVVLDGKRLPDPCTRLQPKGLRGPSRIVDPARLDVDGPALEGRRAARPRPLRAARRHVHARGDVRRGDRAPAAGCASSASPASSCMPVADVPGRARLGLRRRLPVAAHAAYGGPTGCSGWSTPRTRAGIAVCSTSSTTTSARRARRRSSAFGPYFTEPLRDALGRGDQLRRRGLRRGARVGAAERASAGSATSTSTACGSTRSTPSSTRAPSTCSPSSRDRVHAVDAARARDRRERA